MPKILESGARTTLRGRVLEKSHHHRMQTLCSNSSTCRRHYNGTPSRGSSGGIETRKEERLGRGDDAQQAQEPRKLSRVTEKRAAGRGSVRRVSCGASRLMKWWCCNGLGPCEGVESGDPAFGNWKPGPSDRGIHPRGVSGEGAARSQARTQHRLSSLHCTTVRAGSSRRGPRHGNLGMARGGHGLNLSPAQSSFGVIKPHLDARHSSSSDLAPGMCGFRGARNAAAATAAASWPGFNAAWWAPASGFASHKAASGPSPFPFRGPASLLSVVP
jgi:hypothetical protein